MTMNAFQPTPGEFQADAWRAIDRLVHRWVLRHGGSPLLARVAAWCSWAEGQGHTLLPLRGAHRVADMEPLRDDEWDRLRAEPMVGDAADSVFVLDANGCFAFRRNARAEADVAARLLERIGPAAPVQADPDLIDALFGGRNDATVAAQRLAVERALSQRLLVLTGGPGTGKTSTVLRMLLALLATFDGREPVIAVAAPTGKAAQRLVQALREGREALLAHVPAHVRALVERLPTFDARTVHRLLRFDPVRQVHRRNRSQPLAAEIVVIDEASMLDLDLLRALLDAVPTSARLILVGDADQLVSVAAGAVLADIVRVLERASSPSLVRLSHVFRAETELAALNAAIRQGDAAAFAQAVGQGGERIRRVDIADAASRGKAVAAWAAARVAVLRDAVRVVEQPDDAAQALRVAGSTQLLCALRDGPYGAATLDRELEALVRDAFDVPDGLRWFAGRMVMVTRNDESHGLFNGDVGIALIGADGALRVWFDSVDGDGRRSARAILPNLLPEHEGALAITIHKSQGSEYRDVAVVLPPDVGNPVLSRELLYTGASRAKQSLAIWGGDAIIDAALARPVVRHGALADRLEQGMGDSGCALPS